MKLSKLVGERFRERPGDCVAESHALMLRGGYMKNVANGIYSSYTPLKRITAKIEAIIREEMEAIDGQEVQFPVVMPAALWQESGRYESIGSELMRLKDRNDTELVLGMTHEEAAVHLVRDWAKTYSRYPFMIYQIQTKFRDEARPRAGLIRVREFTMKDGYSFHISEEDMQEYYSKCLKAYEKIYARVGVPEVVTVVSDAGMMGGSVSHEFMLLTDIGEDSIVSCKSCDYRSNMEAAECITETKREDISTELKKVNTPNIHSIDELCEFFTCKSENACKAVVYQKNEDDSFLILFIRGDLEANETKLRNFLGFDIHPAEITEDSGLNAGFIGPLDLSDKFTVLFDRSLDKANGLICGANENGFHLTGLDISRDLSVKEFHDFAKAQEGGICPVCGKHELSISRGIEVGNIFQLGTKYTKSMNMTYTDKDGNIAYPLMGCYGIGLGRLAASVCEAHHDDMGPIWPMPIAPWQIHLCAVRADNEEVHTAADKLYAELQATGTEVIYDDRSVSAGVMFSDADLLGVPLRVIISPRNLKENCAEIVLRDKSMSLKVPMDEVEEKLLSLKNELMKLN